RGARGARAYGGASRVIAGRTARAGLRTSAAMAAFGGPPSRTTQSPAAPRRRELSRTAGGHPETPVARPGVTALRRAPHLGGGIGGISSSEAGSSPKASPYATLDAR